MKKKTLQELQTLSRLTYKRVNVNLRTNLSVHDIVNVKENVYFNLDQCQVMFLLTFNYYNERLICDLICHLPIFACGVCLSL